MPNRVTYLIEDDIAEIRMNDGKVNVMSVEMLTDLRQAFEKAETEAKAVVLRSDIPGVFSAGFDLKVFAANDARQSLEMVRAGALLALKLLGLNVPTVGVMAGHAFPMGTFLLLACDVRIGVEGAHKMGLNEVAIQITPPGFAVELARSRLHPAWLSRTVTLGEMFEPHDAVIAGFLDRVEKPDDVDMVIKRISRTMVQMHQPSHVAAKQRLRRPTMDAMKSAIESELTLDAYENRGPSEVLLPG